MTIEEALKSRSLWENGVSYRNGHEARVLCIDANCPYPVVTLEVRNGSIQKHYANGEFSSKHFPGEPHGYDLVLRPVKRKGWINIYEGEDETGSACWRYGWKSAEDASYNAATAVKRIACIEVEFLEGEGL